MHVECALSICIAALGVRAVDLLLLKRSCERALFVLIGLFVDESTRG